MGNKCKEFHYLVVEYIGETSSMALHNLLAFPEILLPRLEVQPNTALECGHEIGIVQFIVCAGPWIGLDIEAAHNVDQRCLELGECKAHS